MSERVSAHAVSRSIRWPTETKTGLMPSRVRSTAPTVSPSSTIRRVVPRWRWKFTPMSVAAGTALERSESEVDLTLKAASYEMPAWHVDGMDVVAVGHAARRATEMIRGGAGPVFLEARTYRFRAHSMYDPDLYRDRQQGQVEARRVPFALEQRSHRAGGKPGSLGQQDPRVFREGIAGLRRDRDVERAEMARHDRGIGAEIDA